MNFITSERIKVVWTPYFRTMTVFRNKFRWDDKNVNEAKRMSTFDGATEDIEVKLLISPQLTNTIETLCKAISNHILEVSGNSTQISIMTLYLQRTDSESVCKLLFCTQLKVRKLSPHKLLRKQPKNGQKAINIEPHFIACDMVIEDYEKTVNSNIKIKSHRQGFFRNPSQKSVSTSRKGKLNASKENIKEDVPRLKYSIDKNCGLCLGRYR